MRKLFVRSLLSTSLFLFISILKAQPSINSTHMPQAGDTLRYSVSVVDTAILQSFADTGANKVWNFDSLLIPISQGLEEYLNSNQTPYNISGKIAQKIADTLSLQAVSLYDVYDYFTNSTSSFAANQRGFTIPTGLGPPFPPLAPFSPNYTDPDEIYSFPLNYGDRDSSSFNFTFNNIFPPAYYSTSGYRINEVEAWGTISTPFGSFSCLKVKTDIIQYDTISFGTLSLGDSSHTREYKWISPQLKFPAMILNGRVFSGTFFPINIEYRDSVRSTLPSLLEPVALFFADTTEVWLGDTLGFNNLTVSFSSVNYSWDIQPTTFSYINGTNANSVEPQVIFADTGFYDVRLIATNSAGADTLLREDYIQVNQSVSIQEVFLGSEKLRLIPNPVQKGTELSLSNPIPMESVQLYDLSMRKISDWRTLKAKQFTIDIDEQLESGTYILIIETERNTISKKLIIQ